MGMKKHIFFVSRQHYYYADELVVEIAQGGCDYSGADCLAKRFPGEMEDYVGMFAAMEAAISIARAWKKIEKGIRIVHGCTHGMFTELPDSELFTERLAKKLLKAAKQFDDEKLNHCQRCGDIMPEDQGWGNGFTPGEYPFCSDNCASMAESEWQEELEREDALV